MNRCPNAGKMVSNLVGAHGDRSGLSRRCRFTLRAANGAIDGMDESVITERNSLRLAHIGPHGLDRIAGIHGYTMHAPYYDHRTLCQLYEKLEIEFGLERDNPLRRSARGRGGQRTWSAMPASKASTITETIIATLKKGVTVGIVGFGTFKQN